MIYRKRKRPFKFANSNRNYRDPQYKQWRKDVSIRDGGRCQWPGCKKTKKLNVHHIRKWSEYSSLRFDVDNGILLCYGHHKETFRKEADFEILFSGIVARNKALKNTKIDPDEFTRQLHNIRAEIRHDKRQLPKADRPSRDT